MLSLADALERCLALSLPLRAEAVPLDRALGRVLVEDVRAPHDQLRWTASAMDGFTVRTRDLLDQAPPGSAAPRWRTAC